MDLRSRGSMPTGQAREADGVPTVIRCVNRMFTIFCCVRLLSFARMKPILWMVPKGFVHEECRVGDYLDLGGGSAQRRRVRTRSLAVPTVAGIGYPRGLMDTASDRRAV